MTEILVPSLMSFVPPGLMMARPSFQQSICSLSGGGTITQAMIKADVT